jgi:hypothetical protein
MEDICPEGDARDALRSDQRVRKRQGLRLGRRTGPDELQQGAEFVIQRGGAYRIKRIERRQVDASESPKVIVWVEHHPELGYDLFQQDERDDNG